MSGNAVVAAGALVKWHNELLVNRSAAPAAERNGAIEFLAADKSTAIAPNSRATREQRVVLDAAPSLARTTRLSA